jgi:hypothetical protein
LAPPGFAPPDWPPSNDLGKKGDPLPQLQMVGMLETPVLRAFREGRPRIVAKNVAKVSSRFNKAQQANFVTH